MWFLFPTTHPVINLGKDLKKQKLKTIPHHIHRGALRDNAMERISQEYFCHISHNILGVHSEICDIFCDWWSVFDFCIFCHIHHIPSFFPKLIQHSHHHLQVDWHLKYHKQDLIKMKVVMADKKSKYSHQKFSSFRSETITTKKENWVSLILHQLKGKIIIFVRYNGFPL